VIEVPMFETMMQFTLGDHLGGHVFEPPAGPPGYARTLTKERRPYPTRNGYVCVIIYTDRHWRSFFDLVGQPERFETDERVQTLLARTTHAKDLYKEVGELLVSRDTEEWLDLLVQADIPCTPMHTIESALADRHLAATGFFRVVDHPTEGPLRQMRVPTTWSGWTPEPPRPAPQLGADTESVLRDAGVAEETIALVLSKLRSPVEGPT
jgi:crotonobetainyl-CoA:carnitine CoA-transferase CaiB-like acyl-CoA transferase